MCDGDQCLLTVSFLSSCLLFDCVAAHVFYIIYFWWCGWHQPSHHLYALSQLVLKRFSHQGKNVLYTNIYYSTKAVLNLKGFLSLSPSPINKCQISNAYSCILFIKISFSSLQGHEPKKKQNTQSYYNTPFNPPKYPGFLPDQASV